ncbi:hypothetical protein AGDE_15091 [Angomonas deanei]|uniref:Uncharacterized protein n=1 Tax=Angomonas deanei TaxID=59799 RepID=A0A7G2CP48_9TRYP|nr:hypothetical protein AGDE_15091 [Angomonas deanei]CAD2221129.1 hypothetical protein, conserved [Angomonas deanei]|eukprot:EPY19742.1 hypothetical protein AGDE_15091 [Angomonas deanei]
MSDTLQNPPGVPDVTSVKAKSLKPLTEDPNYVTETFAETLARLEGPTVNSDFGVPQWVFNLVETTKGKDKLVKKGEDFTDGDKEIIGRIFNVIQTQTGVKQLPLRGDLEKNDPSHYSSKWGIVKRNNKEITDGRAVMAEFLRRSLSLASIDPNNNALICAAAMLLDLSCTIDEFCFCDHVRRVFKDRIADRFGCCLVVDAPEELKHQSYYFSTKQLPRLTKSRNGRRLSGRGQSTRCLLAERAGPERPEWRFSAECLAVETKCNWDIMKS